MNSYPAQITWFYDAGDWDDTAIYGVDPYPPFGSPLSLITPMVTYDGAAYVVASIDQDPVPGTPPDEDDAWRLVAGSGGGGGTITTLTSTDGSIVVTNASGPTANVSVTTTTSSKTANYTMLTTDVNIVANTSGITITLPNATLVKVGKKFTVYVGAGVSNVTVNTTSSQNIVGVGTSIVLTSAGYSISVISDGTEWLV